MQSTLAESPAAADFIVCRDGSRRPSGSSGFEDARRFARNVANFTGTQQSNYPDALANLAEWDALSRWNQRVIDNTRHHLEASRLAKRTGVSAWEQEQRETQGKARRVDSIEERRLLRMRRGNQPSAR